MTHPKSITATVAVNFILVMTLGSAALAAPVCEGIFAKTSLEQTLESQIQSLAEYRVKLDDAKAEGQSSAALSAQESDYTKKENAVFEHVKKNNLMTAAQLIATIKSAMSRLQTNTHAQHEARIKAEEQESKKEEQQRTLISQNSHDGSHAIFQPIEPGTFEMHLEIQDRRVVPPVNRMDKIPVTVTRRFDMMSTPVTQVIWKEIADLINSRFNEGLPPEPSYFHGPLLPVESISSQTIDTWIGNLNKLSQLGVPGLEKILQDHQPGDQYRLPTEAEWAFVLSKRGQSSDDYFFGNDPSHLSDYAWYSENSGKTTHDVAQKLPLEVDGAKFYDMIGNVAEVMAATQDPSSLRNTLHPSRGMRVTRGGTYDYTATDLKPHAWGYLNIPFRQYGFRLVREPRDSGGTP